MPSIDNKSMRKSLFSKAITSVVAVLMLHTVTSCVNEKYDMSEDNLDLKVTVFQEGIALPIGSTGNITLESLYSQLDEDTKKMLKEMEGAYIFHMTDSQDLTEDIAGSLSDIGNIDAITFDEKFSFSLASIDLSFIDIEPTVMGPEVVDVTDRLKIPDLDKYLPEISENMSVSKAIPTITAEDLAIDLSSLDDQMHRDAEVAALDGQLGITDEFAESSLAQQEMNYDDIRQTLWNLGMHLPVMKESYEFEPYDLDIPVEIALPKIQEVRSIALHPDASFDLTFEIVNPLFTGGSITPELDVDLHEMFLIDKIRKEDGSWVEGEDFSDHVMDKFVLSPENGWKVSHRYHISALVIEDGDWTKEGEDLILRKTYHLNLAGTLVEKDLVTTLKHLHDFGHEPMKIKMEVVFNNLLVDDVQMVIDPIEVGDELELPIEVDPVSIPSLVKSIDFIDFKDEAPLNIDMQAVIPDACSTMDLTLKTFKVEFPEGIVIRRPAGSLGTYDETSRTLSYDGISLADGLDDEVIIDGMTLPEIVGGQLSYSGKVKVVAQAQVEGVLSSKKLMESAGGDVEVKVKADFAPELEDYRVTTDDYLYNVNVEPVHINESVDKSVGEFLEKTPVYVSLKQDVPGQNQKILINMDFPQHEVVKVVPLPGEGLKFDFPDMVHFTDATMKKYNINPSDNVVHYTGDVEIPRVMELEIDCVEVAVEKVGESGEYAIMDDLTVTGGICVKGTSLDKQDVDELIAMGIRVEFGAEVPRLAPDQFGMDEYKVTVDEKVALDKMEIELPDMIKSLEVNDLTLKDVYLELEVDASSITEIAGNVDMSMNLDLHLPSEIKVDGADQNNVLHISQDVNTDNKIVLDPVHVAGLDLSSLEIEDGKLTMDAKEVLVKGYVQLKNISIDVDKLEGKDLEVTIKGSLSSRGEDGKASDKIALDKINGHVGLEIDPITTTVDLSSLAETLNGDNMSLTIDLNTYWLTLDIETNLDVPVSGTLEIVPWYGGEPAKKEIRTIEMDPAKRVDDKYRFFVSNLDPSDPESGSRYEAYKDYGYINLDLISLLYHKEEGSKPMIADSLQVSVNAGVDSEKTCTIEPSKDYKFKFDYALGVPLELGEEFAFEYRDTIAALPDEAAMLLGYASVGLGGKVTSSFPLGMDLQIFPLDSNNDRIPLKEGDGKMKIASCNSKGEPVTTKLDFLISGKGSDLSDMKALELVFTVNSKDAAGVPFGPECFLNLSLSARIPEGVTADLREFINTDDNQDEQDNQDNEN